MIKEILLATSFVLVGATENSEYILMLGKEEVPAKSLESCEKAIEAIRSSKVKFYPKGALIDIDEPIPPTVELKCIEGKAFDKCSNYIVGYNTPKECK